MIDDELNITLCFIIIIIVIIIIIIIIIIIYWLIIFCVCIFKEKRDDSPPCPKVPCKKIERCRDQEPIYHLWGKRKERGGN